MTFSVDLYQDLDPLTKVWTFALILLKKSSLQYNQCKMTRKNQWIWSNGGDSTKKKKNSEQASSSTLPEWRPSYRSQWLVELYHLNPPCWHRILLPVSPAAHFWISQWLLLSESFLKKEKNYRFTIYIYHLTVKATFNIVQENFKRLVKSTSVFYAPRIHIFFTEKGLLIYSLLTNLSLINCEIKLLQIKVSLPYLDNIFINTMYIRQFF